jgi:hypothetical protein
MAHQFGVALFELKVVEQAPDGRAIAQLQSKGYADKSRTPIGAIAPVL